MSVPRLVLVLVCFLVSANVASAATLYIDPPQSNLGRGDAQIFKVRLDTNEAEEECINAVSGVIQFSGPLTPVDISTGASILSIWLEPPTVATDAKQVTFAGGIPNGYCGRIQGDPNLTNVLFEIIARADIEPGATEVATVAFTNETTAYLNDGRGTLANITRLPSRVSVAAEANPVVADPWTAQVAADTQAPQEFSIQLTRDERAFGGKYYITFNTTDKQTGIDHYEVLEEPLSQTSAFLWGGVDAPWREAISPYILRDQSLNSVIRVRAVDKAGNEYVASLVPDEALRTISATQIINYVLMASLGLILLLGIWLFVRRQQRRRLQAMIEPYAYDDTK